MENLILSFNVVLPLFLSIALGYALRCMHMLDETTQKNLNKLVFKVFLPIYVFNNIYTTDMAVAFNPGLAALALCGILGILFS